MAAGRAHTLQRYILKEYALSFLISFLFFFFIFFVNQILLVARNILIRNVSFVDMLKILLYSIPIILSYTFPFSSMTGATMSLGNLSSRNEIMAMRTGGISYSRILAPILLFSILLTGVSFVLNDVFLPLGTIKYKALYKELLYENPGLDLESYSISRFNDLIFVNGKVDENTVDDLLVIDTSNSQIQVISADSARLTSDNLDQMISLDLSGVQSIGPKSSSSEDFDYYQADSMEYYLAMDTISFNLLSVAPNEKSLRDLFGDIRDKQDDIAAKQLSIEENIEEIEYRIASDYLQDAARRVPVSYADEFENRSSMLETSVFSKTLQYYLLEFYKKTALPFACLFLVIYAFPFSMIQMKNGRLVGFSVGIITSVAYWFLLFAGQTLGTRVEVDAFLIMWAPNIVLFCIGLLLIMIRRRA